MLETIIYIFILKFSDCALGTVKTLMLVKNKFFLSSVANSLSALLFIFVADSMANSDPDSKIWIALVIFIANLVGGYFPPKLIDKLEEDKLFIFNITSSSIEEGKILADQLRELNIPITTSVSYNKEINKVLMIRAYSESRDKSKIILTYLRELPEFKWHIVESY